MPSVYAQHYFAIRFCWGMEGLDELTPHADTVVIVDVLRFTSCVSVACDRGAIVLPYEWGPSAADYAAEQSAELAGKREDASSRWSLSPTDISSIELMRRLNAGA